MQIVIPFVIYGLVFGLAILWSVFGIVSLLRGYFYGLGFIAAGVAVILAAVYLSRNR